MQVLEAGASAAVLQAVRRFIHPETTGCSFAREAISKGENVAYGTFVGLADAATGSMLTTLLDQAATQRELAVIIFPRLQSAADVRVIVDTLAATDRWSLKRAETTGTSGEKLLTDTLHWRNAEGELVSIMGLAPLLSMPVTRRAPYVCFVAWPGARSNKFRAKPQTAIGIGDMPLREKHSGLDQQQYTDLRQATRSRIALLNGSLVPGDITFLYEHA